VEGKHTAGVTVQEPLAEPEMAEMALTGRPAWPARDLAFMHAPMGIHEIDGEGRIVRVNPAFCRMTGYGSYELVGRSLADFADRAGDFDPVEHLKALLARGAGVDRFSLGYLRKDGSLLQARITAGVIPGRSGHAASVIALVEDATSALPGADDAELGRARIDAVETVGAAVAEARDAASEKGIDIAYAYASAPVWVRADEDELRRAVDELLASAVRTTQLGSLAVRCTERGGDALLEVLEVREPGEVGADLDRVFAAAAEAEASAARQDRDRDLGSMRALVQAHEGNVGMTSSPESGNRITVRLPLARG